MEWKILSDESELEEIRHRSSQKPQLIFKHSTRCAISSLAKNRLESSPVPEGIDFYYLDLIRYRNISNKIESDFSVCHESPQVLLIRNGKCIYDESHNAITMKDVIINARF